MCRYPLGSGGKRVCTLPLYLLLFRSSTKMSRMKFEGRDSGAACSPVSASVSDVFIALILPQGNTGVGCCFAIRRHSWRGGRLRPPGDWHDSKRDASAALLPGRGVRGSMIRL